MKRRNWMKAIDQIQRLIGDAMAHNHDRNPNKAAETRGFLEDAHNTCIAIRSGMPIPKPRDRKTFV